MNDLIYRAIKTGIDQQLDQHGRWITGRNTAAVAAALEVEDVIKQLEAKFHQAIKLRLPRREQGYVMGAWREVFNSEVIAENSGIIDGVVNVTDEKLRQIRDFISRREDVKPCPVCGAHGYTDLCQSCGHGEKLL